MLAELHIQNYALIKDSIFYPKQGLNTITGETGAGKSILLGALGLITGKRADTSVLFDKEAKCIVEASFEISEYKLEPIFEELDLDFETTTIIRREINPAGKSRAFINDTPVTLDSLKKLGVFLIDVHSQNETMKLNTQAYQTNILDLLTDSKPLLKEYQVQFKLVNSLNKELREVIEGAEKEKATLDFNLFQLNELQTLNLSEINDEKLENEVQVIENFTEVKTLLSSLYNLVDEGEFSLSNALGEVTSLSKDLAKLSKEYTSLDERFQSMFFELQDLSKELSNSNDNLEIDEESAEEKLNTFNKLQNLLKKHNVSSSIELLKIQDALEQKTAKASNLDAHIESLRSKIEKEENKLIQKGKKLDKNRLKHVKSINSKTVSLSAELGMPNAVFEINFTELEIPTSTGLSNIQFLFSANKGVETEEISKVASGGEFSRLMFCLKYLLAERTNLPTIIFDEIDTGISGEVALKMGKLMQNISGNHQLICITHLPQIASKGGHHFYVYKDNSGNQTTSNLRLLTDDERIIKIAEMISGENPDSTAKESAKALLSH